MKYVLNLAAADNRILSAYIALPGQSYEGKHIVSSLPEGDIYDFRYINDGYIYDPVPKVIPSIPKDSAEEKVKLLEEQLTEQELAYYKGVNSI